MTLDHATRSVKEMKEDDSLRTIECLRGRLVAERQASRAAKENAELTGNKLKELEEKLKEEKKLRDRAEKKLKFLQRKLESMNISLRSEGSDRSSISENSLVSCESSITTTVTSGSKREQDQEPNPETSFDSEPDVSKTTTLDRTHDISCNVDGHHSPDMGRFLGETSGDNDSSELEGFKSTEHHSARISVPEEEKEDECSVDNSLALVPITLQPAESQSRSKELKLISRSVSEVLETLRLAREGIQRTMRQNHMMKIRPPQPQIC